MKDFSAGIQEKDIGQLFFSKKKKQRKRNEESHVYSKLRNWMNVATQVEMIHACNVLRQHLMWYFITTYLDLG